MDINYELYKVFYHVAATLSFSEASKQLFISQSAVSQSIKVLEKKLNQTLFIRSTKKVQLTPEGEILLKHVEPAINLIQKGENQLLEANTLNGGQLRIGASDTICRYYLIPYLNRFHKAYPNVHIKVTNQTSIECAHLLENGQVDFIITNYPNSGPLQPFVQLQHVFQAFINLFQSFSAPGRSSDNGHTQALLQDIEPDRNRFFLSLIHEIDADHRPTVSLQNLEHQI